MAFVILKLLVGLMVGLGSCQDCFPPTSDDLVTVIGAIIQSGDVSTQPVILLNNFNVVCRAFSEQQGFLHGVSVVVEYACFGHSNCPSDTVIEQIESGCISGGWTNNVAGTTSSSHIRTTAPTATLSTATREDCSFCFSPTLGGLITDPINHCVGQCSNENISVSTHTSPFFHSLPLSM